MVTVHTESFILDKRAQAVWQCGRVLEEATGDPVLITRYNWHMDLTKTTAIDYTIPATTATAGGDNLESKTIKGSISFCSFVHFSSVAKLTEPGSRLN